MIFGKIFNDKDTQNNGDSTNGVVNDQQKDVGTDYQGDTVAADVRPADQIKGKSKDSEKNIVLGKQMRKRRANRIVHTKRQFHRQKQSVGKDQVYIYDIIKRPVITEKVANLSEQNTYAFFVDRASTKQKVMTAIEAIYGVSPIKVRMAKKPSKQKRIRVRGREREYGTTAKQKKAYVFLKKGDTIQLT